jgi:predicted nucleic acid-binding protein
VILVDTSVWIDHFRRGDATLANLLGAGVVACHPFVIGELACGGLKHRARVLDALGNLSPVPVATHHEAMMFLEQRGLAARGIGWVDVHLLASTALAADACLWTRDKRLAGVAASLGMAYAPA